MRSVRSYSEWRTGLRLDEEIWTRTRDSKYSLTFKVKGGTRTGEEGWKDKSLGESGGDEKLLLRYNGLFEVPIQESF